MISNNRLEWAVAYFATVSLGAQIIPMYEAQKESDWQYIIKDSEAKIILAATEKVYAQTESYINTVAEISFYYLRVLRLEMFKQSYALIRVKTTCIVTSGKCSFKLLPHFQKMDENDHTL